MVKPQDLPWPDPGEGNSSQTTGLAQRNRDGRNTPLIEARTRRMEEMGRLRDDDLRAILGPDFARIIEAEFNSAKPVTPAEIRRSREKEANRLSEMRFTMFAVVVVGVALDFASWYQKSGFDIQAAFGAAAILFGLGGLVILTKKRRAVLNAPMPDAVTA